MILKSQKNKQSTSINISAKFLIQALINTSISLKGDNQRSIVFTYNPTYNAWIKYIDIQHHYICDEVAARQINLQYIPTSKMIANRLTKALTHAKFYTFVK